MATKKSRKKHSSGGATLELNEDMLRIAFGSAALAGLCANPNIVEGTSDAGSAAELAFDIADEAVDQFLSYEESDDEDEEEEEEEEDDDD